jgi:hypothetical protein
MQLSSVLYYACYCQVYGEMRFHFKPENRPENIMKQASVAYSCNCTNELMNSLAFRQDVCKKMIIIEEGSRLYWLHIQLPHLQTVLSSYILLAAVVKKY